MGDFGKRPRRLSNVSFTPIGLQIKGPEKTLREKEVSEHGLGVVTAAIFLAGEMAGSGVLALPFAMKGTSWWGLGLITFFCINAAFSGTRLGLCWVILEQRYEEFRKEIRDPYPSIGEKAVGKWGRLVCVFCICCTLYGAGCVFIVLIAQCLKSLFVNLALEVLEGWTECMPWMMITACILIPLTWLGTPKDFWPIAVGALLTTVLACMGIMIQALIDNHYCDVSQWDVETRRAKKCFTFKNGTEYVGDVETVLNINEGVGVNYPDANLWGSIKAFASIMYAFAGASTFPTIQADMKEKTKFKWSAYMACILLFLIYLPMGAIPYYGYGDLAADNVVKSMTDGPLKITVEILLLLHLVSAYPILTNPPAQYFEQLLNIPSEFGWKRCLFRTISVCVLLFVAESIPSFGALLDVVGASTVTMLTFVCPPFFYMKLCDQSLDNNRPKDWPAEWKRIIPLWERIYCWFLMSVGMAGGIAATYIAVYNLFTSEFGSPCYVNLNQTIAAGH